VSSLRGIKCLVTAGPTYEAIDPVRFIGNRSSGKMGIAIADDLTKRGAEVILILGPSSEKIPTQIAKVVRVESADDMYHAVMSEIKTVRLGIFSAAVADYKPKVVAQEKIKKAGEELSIDLVKTVDILAEVGKQKSANQVIVGFALETNNEEENAKQKIVKKNLDMIVLNSLKDTGAGFQHDTNQIMIIDKENNSVKFELKSKLEVAVDINNYIESKFFST
jgi:phosphopantothenoylcysteine decarboxylase/phosphopantothenate--cysteine ligase